MKLRCLYISILISCFFACQHKISVNNLAVGQSGSNSDVQTGSMVDKQAALKTSAYEVQTGGIKMITVAGKYKVWTKKIGDGKIKVLLLHGGPGFSHDYFECFESFLPKKVLNSITMISWEVAIQICPLTPRYGTFRGLLKKSKQSEKDWDLNNFICSGIHGVVC